MKKIVAVIPARLSSSRLPRKILADIQGRPLIWHVWQRVTQAKLVDKVFIATDSDEVKQVAETFGGQVLMTSPDCQSGTERIASVIHHLQGDLIINIQGDEPLISPELIDTLIKDWFTHPCDMITAVKRIEDPKVISNPNVVKVVRSSDGRALYFSRSPVPFVRDVEIEDWLNHGRFWQHIGIYGYSRKLLEAYSTLPESLLEIMEKLEQLRFLEAGYSIRVVETDYQPHSVDVLADLEKVRKIMQQSEKNDLSKETYLGID